MVALCALEHVSPRGGKAFQGQLGGRGSGSLGIRTLEGAALQGLPYMTRKTLIEGGFELLYRIAFLAGDLATESQDAAGRFGNGAGFVQDVML
jgi:hypothetical protein